MRSVVPQGSFSNRKGPDELVVAMFGIKFAWSNGLFRTITQDAHDLYIVLAYDETMCMPHCSAMLVPYPALHVVRSPVLVGGGRAHGPKPRDWSYSMPRKVMLYMASCSSHLHWARSARWQCDVYCQRRCEQRARSGANFYTICLKDLQMLLVVTRGEAVGSGRSGVD